MNNLNPLHPRMHCAKFSWNKPSGSVDEDFKILSMYFCFFVVISPWIRIWPFNWTNLNLLHPCQGCFVPSLVKIGPVVLFKKKIFLISYKNVFWLFVIISPWKRAGSFIWTNLNPLHPRMLWPSLVDIGLVILEKTMKMWQVCANNNDDNDRHRINFDQKSSLETLAQVS